MCICICVCVDGPKVAHGWGALALDQAADSRGSRAHSPLPSCNPMPPPPLFPPPNQQMQLRGAVARLPPSLRAYESIDELHDSLSSDVNLSASGESSSDQEDAAVATALEIHADIHSR